MNMTGVFFIGGPTATGKSAIAADAAREIGAEIVSADAFQIYEGFEILSAKPDAAALAKAPHHLIGSVSVAEEMNAGKFCRLALPLIEKIRGRGARVLVVGGSGLYMKALTHGLDNDWEQVTAEPEGVFVFRDREELYGRINRRVQQMFDQGAIDEVRNSGPMSRTASKMIGIQQIRDYLEGKLPRKASIDRVQTATRQYAKRQLTWFRHQTRFALLNLSLLSHGEAVKWICERAGRVFAKQG